VIDLSDIVANSSRRTGMSRMLSRTERRHAIFVKANMSSSCCTTKPAPKLKRLDTLTTVYSALSDATRLRMLALIKDGETCVCHIHGALGVPQPTASRHLAYLRRAGLVDTRRAGVWMHYRLATISDPVIAAIVNAALHALTHTEVTARDHQRLQVERAAS
jgi:ArsR family transcriptional regulator, arsenate/arsenite/antimonite-responsive transcriptional repressor